MIVCLPFCTASQTVVTFSLIVHDLAMADIQTVSRRPLMGQSRA